MMFMQQKSRSILTLVASSMIVAGLSAIAFADNTVAVSTAASSTGDFTRRPYFGVGIGSSRLYPEDECPCLGVSDDSDTGFSLTLGYDINRWLSAEIYYGDLGAAEIEFLGSDVGPVEYKVVGASAIGYFFNSQSGWLFSNNGRGLHRREGLSLYGRLGIGTIDNDTDLDYSRDYPVHKAIGLGAEYGFKNGFALRAEYTTYDADAQFASITLLKRFGRVPTPALAVPVATVAAPTETPITNTDDGSTESRSYVAVPPPILYFGFDQDDLSPTAQAQLNTFVDEIAGADYGFVIEGHADWVGGESYNQRLSERRATATYQYLLEKGIAASRMTTRGFGEDQPSASNHTAAGRSQNRRVEFIIK